MEINNRKPLRRMLDRIYKINWIKTAAVGSNLENPVNPV
jgi:hypothetical protein